jgi:hypothetical protein
LGWIRVLFLSVSVFRVWGALGFFVSFSGFKKGLGVDEGFVSVSDFFSRVWAG